jgi:hypothetical protein
VGVVVEQAGQQAAPGHVDDLVAVQPRADGDDAAGLDDHVGVPDRRAGAVEDPAAGQDRPAHVRSLPQRGLRITKTTGSLRRSGATVR